MSYSLVALPNSFFLASLDTIRTYLYTHDFRYTNSLPTDPAHITLAQLNFSSDHDILQLNQSLQEYLKDFQPFFISQRKIINQEHTRIKTSPKWKEKYPNGASWVALGFEDVQLQQLSQSLRTFAAALQIDDSYTYANNIAQAKGEYIETPNDVYKYMANHMNICNYARVDRTDEAIEYFQQHFTETKIIIDTIALKVEKQGIIWTLPL